MYTILLLDLLWSIIPIVYFIGIFFCFSAGTQREIGWFSAVLIGLVLTPFIGIICVFSTKSKKELQNDQIMINQNQRIIELLEKEKA